MATQGQFSKKISFADFELDLETAELWNGESKIVLPGKPFEVLKVLLEQPGRLVERRELIERLWPDGTFVDFDQSLNKAVNRLRDALNDSAEAPTLIETLPRKGYRFIGALSNPAPESNSQPSYVLTWPKPPIDENQTPELASSSSPKQERISQETALRSLGAEKSPKWTKLILGVSTAALILGSLFYYRWMRIHRNSEKPTIMLEASPFAAFQGEKHFPSFSPDGSRIAFALNSEGKGFDLYVKAVGSESLLRLTHHPSKSISSAWSPDGTQIAFHRIESPDSGIYLVPALGGLERRVHTTRIVGDLVRALPISWSPDGQWIAFADVADGSVHSRISLLSTATLRSEPIRSWPGCQQEDSPSFSHDGKSLAFACFMGKNDSALYRWQVKSGELEKIAAVQGFVYGVAWTPDDNDLIYALQDGATPGLREVSIKTGSVRQLGFTGSALFPAVSSGGHLSFVTTTSQHELWRLDLRHPESPAGRLVPSTAWEQDPDISPDGKHIAFQSGRSGTAAIWISDIDGGNLTQLSTPGITSGSPRWAPDGTRLAYDARPTGNWEIYVVDVAERIPRKLVTNLSSAIRPHWSRDGRWIYFRSYDPGKAGIYRCAASGGNAIRLSVDDEAFSPVESADGSAIYFTSRQWKSLLKRINIAGGAESSVEGMPLIRASAAWALTPGGAYFVPAEEPNALFYFDFGTRRAKRIVARDRDFGLGLSISRDSTWIAFSDHSGMGGEILFVDRLQ
jgi:Tol biopolymer transport system component/DNA-binding winged helix-turn-helix (wHTH) protein